MVRFSLALEGDKKLEEYFQLSLLAEKLGFYSVQIYDHLPYKPALPICYLIANNTTKIKIGPVTTPFFLHEPFQLLRYIYFLNEISNRRAILGLSRGAYHEFLKKEIKRDIERFLEVLSEIENIIHERRINWATDELELYIGTSGPRLLSNALKFSIVKGIVVDMLWNPNYARKLKDLIEQSNRQGISLVSRPFTCISDDEEYAYKQMLVTFSQYGRSLIGNSPMLKEAGIYYEDLGTMEKIDRKILANFAAIGKIGKILEETAKMVEAGVDHICFGHPLGADPVQAIKEIGNKIISYFKDSS